MKHFNLTCISLVLTLVLNVTCAKQKLRQKTEETVICSTVPFDTFALQVIDKKTDKDLLADGSITSVYMESSRYKEMLNIDRREAAAYIVPLMGTKIDENEKEVTNIEPLTLLLNGKPYTLRVEVYALDTEGCGIFFQVKSVKADANSYEVVTDITKNDPHYYILKIDWP